MEVFDGEELLCLRSSNFDIRTRHIDFDTFLRSINNYEDDEGILPLKQKGSEMTRFIRIPDVIKKTGLAKSTICLWVKEGRFPKPIKLSPRVTVWEEDDINYWMKKINSN